MSASPIPFHIAHTPARAREYVLDAFERNENVHGTYTRRAQAMLEERYGVHRVLLTHSATAALEMSAMVLKAARGATRVLMPSYTFASTANAYLRSDYDLEFLDIDPATMNMPLSQVVAAGPAAGSVILPIHYAGHLGEIDAYSSWASEHGMLLVEDAAQALGSSLEGRWAGTFGALAAISLHFTKNIHSSMGGALFINDPDLVDTATYIWERGTNRQALLKGLVDKYSWVELGSSFQGTEIQAALFLAGLEEYDAVVEHRRTLWEGYAALLGGHDDLGLHVQRWDPRLGNNYHAFYIRLETADMADAVREALEEQGIHAYIGYVPLHDSPYGVRKGLCRPLPQTERWAPCILRLPLHTHMDHSDMETVAAVVLDSISGR
ncbi:MAG: DegT/DnrJ/EryC1/StrS family aminotransferase [Actinobacteria bacterium]|nr:DegT/DnrJ/EryC1/StrS family aminotransferase [Actinomycetota bacterium]